MNNQKPPKTGITPEESKSLRKWLPKGYYKIIGHELGYHPHFVNAVATGHKKNPIVLKHLIDMALKNKEALDESRKNFEKLSH